MRRAGCDTVAWGQPARLIADTTYDRMSPAQHSRPAPPLFEQQGGAGCEVAGYSLRRQTFLREALEIILKMWTGGPSSNKGKFGTDC
jgi:hypothetical protein